MSARPEIVLIVEDDPGVAQLHRRRLERAGFEVKNAATATDAFAVLSQGRVDLIVLDYHLPGINGLEFYHQLKANGQDTPVIIVTAFGRETTVIEALRAGVRDFVTKSVEYLDYLPEAVERVLKQVRLEQELALSEARLAGIIASAKDAIIIVDANDRISLFNAAAERMFRCSSQVALGRCLSQFIPQGAAVDGWLSVPDQDTPWAIGMRTDGSQFPIEASVSRLEAAGRTLFTVGPRHYGTARPHVHDPASA